jgi:hypothetical protein
MWEPDEPYIPHVLDFVGEDRLLFASDYPHPTTSGRRRPRRCSPCRFQTRPGGRSSGTTPRRSTVWPDALGPGPGSLPGSTRG